MPPNSHHGPACRPNDPAETQPVPEIIRRGLPKPGDWPKPSKVPVRTGK